MTCIEARGLRKSFGTTVALDGVNLQVDAGRILGLIGPNGAGKTTALNAILGLTSFEGELKVLGRDPWNQRDAVMRDGRLEQVGTATEIYQRPASKFVATFLGASNLFNGTVERRNGGETLVTTGAGLSLSVDGVAADARDVVVSVRPEAVVVNRLNGSSPPQNVPNTIVAEIEKGFRSTHYEKIVDRTQAINRAVELARPHDIVLIAGKGHENYQELADHTIPFDDIQVARRAIEDHPVEFSS